MRTFVALFSLVFTLYSDRVTPFAPTCAYINVVVWGLQHHSYFTIRLGGKAWKKLPGFIKEANTSNWFVVIDAMIAVVVFVIVVFPSKYKNTRVQSTCDSSIMGRSSSNSDSDSIAYSLWHRSRQIEAEKNEYGMACLKRIYWCNLRLFARKFLSSPLAFEIHCFS